jgi:hypothetical protein
MASRSPALHHRVPVRGQAAVGGVVRHHVRRVAAAVKGVQEPAVEVAVEVPRRVAVAAAGRSGLRGGQVQGDADPRARAVVAHDGNGPAVGEQEVVAGPQRRRPVAQPGRVVADLVRLQARAPGLVVGDPVLHAIAQVLDHHLHVFAERVRRRPRGPAARFLQALREVPVEEGRVGDDARFQQGVHQPAVEVEALLVHGAAPFGQDARPGDREAIGLEAELLHEGDVFAPPVIVVAGHVARGPVADPARRAAEPVPDGLPASVPVRGALDLIGGGGGAPDEPGREGRALPIIKIALSEASRLCGHSRNVAYGRLCRVSMRSSRSDR